MCCLQTGQISKFTRIKSLTRLKRAFWWGSCQVVGDYRFLPFIFSYYRVRMYRTIDIMVILNQLRVKIYSYHIVDLTSNLKSTIIEERLIRVEWNEWRYSLSEKVFEYEQKDKEENFEHELQEKSSRNKCMHGVNGLPNGLVIISFEPDSHV